MQYRRAKIPGGTYFFTVVTYWRDKILCIPANVMLLRQIFKKVMEKHPFNIDAFVLLPDHLHCIWTLPQGDSDFSMRWRLIKSYFTRKCQSSARSGNGCYRPVGWVVEDPPLAGGRRNPTKDFIKIKKERTNNLAASFLGTSYQG